MNDTSKSILYTFQNLMSFTLEELNILIKYYKINDKNSINQILKDLTCAILSSTIKKAELPPADLETLMEQDKYDEFVKEADSTSVEELNRVYSDKLGKKTTLLIQAAKDKYDDEKYVNYLLERGVNVDQLAGGRTALNEAVLHRNSDIMETLLDHGANINFIPTTNDFDNFLKEYVKKLLTKPNGCLSGYKIKSLLGEGGFGVVYNVCTLDEKCDHVIKVMDLKVSKKDLEAEKSLKEKIRNDLIDENDTNNGLYKFLKEEYFSELFSSNDIGPKYYGYVICDLGSFGFKGVLIYDKWDRELTFKDIPKLDIDLVRVLLNQIEQIHDLGYLHMDILPKNILAKTSSAGQITDVTISDFGGVIKMNDEPNYNVYARYYIASVPAEPEVARFIGKVFRTKNSILIDYILMYYTGFIDLNSGRAGIDRFEHGSNLNLKCGNKEQREIGELIKSVMLKIDNSIKF